MRIVFVADHASEHTRRWIGFFAERGHEVHVVTCGGPPGPDEGAYTVHDLGAPRFGKAGYLLKLRRARRTIRSLDPDVVHAHHATSYGLLGLTSGAHPFVVTCHGSDVLRSPRNPALRALVRRVLRAADLITVPAEHMRAAVERLIGRATPVAVFQYGVDTAALGQLGTDARSHRTAPGEVARVVSARPLTSLYNTDALIRAAGVLRDRGVDFVLEIAGDGPERTPLEALADGLGLMGQVSFRGRLPEHEALGLLARGDVYVSVAASDGVSIALLEAMALGLIPVVSDIEANRQWIESGVNGVLVPIGSEAIADGVEAALRLDPAAVRARNTELVRSRADRATNLGRCEQLLGELVTGAR